MAVTKLNRENNEVVVQKMDINQSLYICDGDPLFALLLCPDLTKDMLEATKSIRRLARHPKADFDHRVGG